MAKAPTMNAQMAEHQAHGDLHTLIEAEKIKKDKKRHGAAMKKHKEMLSNLKAVTQQPNPEVEPDGDDAGEAPGSAY
jgi:hypothetical protein